MAAHLAEAPLGVAVPSAEAVLSAAAEEAPSAAEPVVASAPRVVALVKRAKRAADLGRVRPLARRQAGALVKPNQRRDLARVLLLSVELGLTRTLTRTVTSRSLPRHQTECRV